MAADTFTYADGALVTVSGGVWQTVDDPWIVSSGRATFTGVGGNDVVAAWATVLTGDDQYAEADVDLTAATGVTAIGVFTRGDPVAKTYMMAQLDEVGGGRICFQARTGPGSWTGAMTPVYATGGVVAGRLKLESIGTTHNIYWNGALIATRTAETNSPPSSAARRVGITGYRETGSVQSYIDNWAGDVVAGTGPQTWTGSPATVAVTGTSGAWTVGSSTGSIRVGSTAITTMKVGAVQVVAAYLGATLVWPSGAAQTWTGSPATATVTATSGTWAGAQTWTRSAATATVTATSGTWSVANAPQTWTRSPATVTVTGTSGTWSVASGGGGTVTFRSASIVANGQVNSITVSKPSGVVAGDLLLIFAHSDDNSTSTCTGFTAVGVGTYTGFGGATRRSHFLWKIAGGSEPTSYVVVNAGSAYNEAHCMAYTGATGVGATGSTNGSFNSAALTVAANNSMEVCVFCFDNASSNAAGPAGWTRRINGNGTYGAWTAERAASAGTTTSSNFTGVGDTGNGYGSVNIILTP